MIVRPVVGPLVSPIAGAVTGLRRGGASLEARVLREFFGNGEKGIFWPSISSLYAGGGLYSDTAGTTAATVGAGVARVQDASGNGVSATQATPDSRLTLRQDANGEHYLELDGIDDSLATPAINFTGTDKMTVLAGVRKESDAAGAIVVELSASFTSNAGTFALWAPSATVSLRYLFGSRGTATATASVSGSAYDAPHSAVLTGQADIAGDSAVLRVNGTPTSVATDQGSGNFGNHPCYIGRRAGASLPFKGRIYSLLVCGAQKSAAQITLAEQLANSTARAY